MTKTYCNMCGREFHSRKEYRKINMRICGKGMLGADWNLDFCEDCFRKVVGNDFYDDFKKKEEKHQQTVWNGSADSLK